MITTIGNHKVKHGDIMDGIDDLMAGEQADLIYSDPPWGQGNLGYWQTMRSKMDKVERKEPANLEAFLAQTFTIIKKYAKGAVIIEYGTKWHDEVKAKAQSYGLVWHGSAQAQYKSGSRLLPLDIHVFSKGNVSVNMDDIRKAVAGTHGYDTLKAIVPHFAVEGGILLDACCGLGYSAKAAVDNRMRFRGNELNLTRLKKTMKRLE